MTELSGLGLLLLECALLTCSMFFWTSAGSECKTGEVS
jgi:hypothetical protein